MSAHTWRLRPAGTEHEGKAVSSGRLRQAIEEGEVGDLDEVLGPTDSNWLPIREHATTGTYVPRLRRSFTREAEEADSDMTPMIDVTFQLVIFFMIAATYTIQKTLDLPKQSPNPDAAGAVTMEQLEQENIIVQIAMDGSILVDDQPTEINDLISSLQEATRARRSAELVLDVDDQTAHDVVVQVLDAAGAANIEKVLFVSRVDS
jgi:biopolymer transport protein ExbD